RAGEDLAGWSRKSERAYAGRSVTFFSRQLSIPQSVRDDPYSLRLRIARPRIMGRLARAAPALHRVAGNGALLENAGGSFLGTVSKIRAEPGPAGRPVHCGHTSRPGKNRQLTAR